MKTVIGGTGLCKRDGELTPHAATSGSVAIDEKKEGARYPLISLDTCTRLLDSLQASAHEDELTRRRRIGHALLQVFDAEVFVSCRSDTAGKFVDPVWIGMSDSNMQNYEQYFQFHDPLTPKMRALGRAAAVRESMNPTDLRRTEFYSDFLGLDGLREGINYFPAGARPGTLDLRIWRTGKPAEFSGEHIRLLQSSGDLIQGLLPASEPAPVNPPLQKPAQPPELDLLTVRERSVARAVARGLSDRMACKELGCSMGTLRTHLSKVFSKLGLGSRGELIALLAPYQDVDVNSAKLPMA